MATNNIGKATSGSPFRPPPAVIWNNMVDAGVAFGEGKFDNAAQPPIRPRSTDIIKIKNDSGGDRTKGQILKIEGKALGAITDESIWLLGVEPTEDCYFGILKEPIPDEKLGAIQVSGCCMALVTVEDTDHTRAKVVDGEYVLESAEDGPIEILYHPGSTGEQTCVVRFAGSGGGRVIGKLDADLDVATAFADDPSTAVLSVWVKDSSGDLVDSGNNITVTNRYLYRSYTSGTICFAESKAGEWHIYDSDCEAT